MVKLTAVVLFSTGVAAGLAQRKAMAGLLAEYAASARRPTVAFPYVALLLLDLVLMLLV